MGYQEFLVTKKHHSVEEFVSVFGEDVTGISVLKQRVVNIDHPVSEIGSGVELVTLYGDRHDIRCGLKERFADEEYWYSEQVNAALIGTSFPTPEQVQCFFDIKKVSELGLKVASFDGDWKEKVYRSFCELFDEGTFVESFRYNELYIVHGELEIVCFNSNYEKQWSFSGRDVFATSDGSRSVRITDEGVCVKDWLGYVYLLSYEGKVLNEYLEEEE